MLSFCLLTVKPHQLFGAYLWYENFTFMPSSQQPNMTLIESSYMCNFICDHSHLWRFRSGLQKQQRRSEAFYRNDDYHSPRNKRRKYCTISSAVTFYNSHGMEFEILNAKNISQQKLKFRWASRFESGSSIKRRALWKATKVKTVAARIHLRNWSGGEGIGWSVWD